MSLHVIELNDSALTAANASGILASSPGFALALGKELQLGTSAEQQARLRPTQSYNKYWHELSLEPINHNNTLRHYADIAHAHLLHLAEEASIAGDAILAVPGNFTREQLAIVLGLTRHTPINTVGVVDSALAASIDYAELPVLIHGELQLHQVLLTRLLCRDGKLFLDSTVQVPGVGSQHFMDYMMQSATREFIQQCRFNPQHDAASEQALYNQLPQWLELSSSEQKNLLMELKTANAVHSAKLPRESLVSGLDSHYQKIAQQLRGLMGSQQTQLLFSARLKRLPGFAEAMGQLGGADFVSESALYQSCLRHAADIIAKDDGVHLQNSLTLGSAGGTVGNNRGKTAQHISHVLYRNRAVAAKHVPITNGSTLNGSAR
ncbi:MAG: hypothetical protein RL120_06085, partial [Gammaproteobacteria bacterium]